jgi:hypothetical protein
MLTRFTKKILGGYIKNPKPNNLKNFSVFTKLKEYLKSGTSGSVMNQVDPENLRVEYEEMEKEELKKGSKNKNKNKLKKSDFTDDRDMKINPENLKVEFDDEEVEIRSRIKKNVNNFNPEEIQMIESLPDEVTSNYYHLTCRI